MLTEVDPMIADAYNLVALGLDVFAVGEHHRGDFAVSAPAVACPRNRCRTRARSGATSKVVSVVGPSPFAGSADIPPWSVQRSLDTMDRTGTRTAILSLTAPGVPFHDPKRAIAMASEVNQLLAGIIERDPSRFGAFAALPLPDVDSALAELHHAIDVLGLDGVAYLAAAARWRRITARVEAAMAAATITTKNSMTSLAAKYSVATPRMITGTVSPT
jgi:predicted TIM-barrel fold metal-dependent hydrolase